MAMPRSLLMWCVSAVSQRTSAGAALGTVWAQKVGIWVMHCCSIRKWCCSGRLALVMVLSAVVHLALTWAMPALTNLGVLTGVPRSLRPVVVVVHAPWSGVRALVLLAHTKHLEQLTRV
jgi:hypothetical protein